MRAFQIEGQWGLDHLKLTRLPDPRPGPGQVLLRMTASSLNFRDLVVADGGYGRHTGTLPLVPVSDGCGVVVEVGAGVDRVAIGDRVCPTFFQGWQGGEPDIERLTRSLGGPIGGTMAELMCLSQEGVVKVPAHLSDLEAATLPCAALTAWTTLAEVACTRPGEQVLVQGCGGVALFAVAFAKLLGAHVTVITSSDERAARVKALGADATVNYTTTPEWSKATRDITAGRGYDLIFELGGEKTLPHSLRCIRPGGMVALIGVLTGGAMTAALGAIVTRHVRLQGVTVGHRDGFEAMLRAVGRHGLRPTIDRVFDFEQLKDAMTYLRSGAQFGKICIAH